MKKVFMFVPAFGQQISATTFNTTHALQQMFASKQIGGSIATLSFPDIAELRSMAFTIWYDSMPDVDYLLFIDADMGFPAEMVTDMMLFDEPLVGAIYPQRRIPLSWAGSGDGGPTTERRGNFMRVEGVGMGCTLIRRDLARTIQEKMPELNDTRIDLHPAAGIMKGAGVNRLFRAFEKMDMPERGIISEDLSFCIRWNKLGGQCWAAIGYRISHVGPYDYSGCYLETIGQQMAQQEAAQSAAVPVQNIDIAKAIVEVPQELPVAAIEPSPKPGRRKKAKMLQAAE